MRDTLAAALAGRVALVVAKDAGAVADVRDAARGADIVLMLIEEAVPKLDRAMLIAALGPLAVEFAPTTRIAALDVAEKANPDDVVAAAHFLADAASTTGQVLRISSLR